MASLALTYEVTHGTAAIGSWPECAGAYRLPTTNSDPRRPPEPLDLEAEIAEEHRERPPGEEPQVR
jgi:hypothetical protein